MLQRDYEDAKGVGLVMDSINCLAGVFYFKYPESCHEARLQATCTRHVGKTKEDLIWGKRIESKVGIHHHKKGQRFQ
jgi:hypothetical protein